ncbi:four helix bundle protein [Elizabethkingia ursingii]|uniref:four helix bundle protein n=1 Tax=Elizabethkingia ursingii TaxID=1756150 RepID=UPI002012FBA9|nr:four helix bundle protein [Elizabethkingia ursingii]MCL1665459.1 four helix bundle protein [Elizabethkingia ursingii]MCL1671681.1 four helix bundle protein [Elizabethkingia ursingii]
MHQFYFEKLEVWQNAKNLSVIIYQLTSNYPEKERFGLTSQMNRSSVSIAANIAEGSTRKSNKDKSRFINIAYGSTIELLNFLIISVELKLISEEVYTELRNKIEHIANQLNALEKRFSA